jgi:exonuclease-1
MTERTIAVLRNNGFSVFVAPCEADPQLAYLCKIGVANAVMTEDSDVVVYATVTKQYFPVLLKYDHYSRQAQEIQLSPECLSSFDAAFDKQKDNRFLRGLRKLSDNLPRALAHICLLAGNDYIENVRGVGLITAAELVVLFRSIPNDKRLFRLVTHLERQRKQVPKGYFLRLQQAEVLFYYQRVYNPLTRSIEHLNPLSTKENVDPLTSSAPFVENMDLSFLT